MYWHEKSPPGFKHNFMHAYKTRQVKRAWEFFSFFHDLTKMEETVLHVIRET